MACARSGLARNLVRLRRLGDRARQLDDAARRRGRDGGGPPGCQIAPHQPGSGNFTVEANGFHCDGYSNAPLDASDPHAGLSTLKCRVRAKNKKDTHSGRRFGEGRTMQDLLQKVQDAGGVQITDCASGGYCGTFAKSIRCTINTTIDNFNNGGRWSCVFTDGQ